VHDLDGRVLAAGVAAFIAAAALIWAPRRRGRLSVRGRDLRQAGRGIVVALAFLAVVPSVLPYDHLVPSSHTEHEDIHTAHCHGAPGACADAPVTSGPGQMLMGEPLTAVPSMLSLLLLVTVVPMIGLTRRPEPRPPSTSAFA
jgi:hypothetical protein